MEKKYDLRGVVLENREVAPGFWHLKVECPEIAHSVIPGQFVMVRVAGNSTDPLLRRPLTVSRIHRDEGALSVLYKTAGRGTGAMAAWGPGVAFEILGPLGNGFSIPDSEKAIAVLGRDAGIGPLAALIDEVWATGRRVYAFLSSKQPALLEYFQPLEERCHLFLFPDGETWRCGPFMTKELEQVATKDPIDRIYLGGLCHSCPSCSLSKNTHLLASRKGIGAQVSLDQYMACGLGACQGCVIPLYKDQKRLETHYKRVCKEGPIFDSWEVVHHG
jgi:dihydroorotate dehydrogenase electron transfer subunit